MRKRTFISTFKVGMKVLFAYKSSNYPLTAPAVIPSMMYFCKAI